MLSWTSPPSRHCSPAALPSIAREGLHDRLLAQKDRPAHDGVGLDRDARREVHRPVRGVDHGSGADGRAGPEKDLVRRDDVRAVVDARAVGRAQRAHRLEVERDALGQVRHDVPQPDDERRRDLLGRDAVGRLEASGPSRPAGGSGCHSATSVPSGVVKARAGSPGRAMRASAAARSPGRASHRALTNSVGPAGAALTAHARVLVRDDGRDGAATCSDGPLRRRASATAASPSVRAPTRRSSAPRVSASGREVRHRGVFEQAEGHGGDGGRRQDAGRACRESATARADARGARLFRSDPNAPRLVHLRCSARSDPNALPRSPDPARSPP